ncbi:MAG: O-antigen ligase family protein, partial [Patescibacteria group bacterium]
MTQALKISNQGKIFILIACFLAAIPLAFAASRAPLLALVAVLGIAGYLLFALKPFWGMVAMVSLLPFERIGAVDYAGITIRPSQVIAVILIITWLTQKAFKGKLEWQKQPILWPILFFLGVNAIGLTHAENLQRSVMVFAFTAFTLLIGLLIPQIIKTEAQVKIVYLTLAITTLLVSCFGLFQFLGDLAGLPTSITGLRDLYTKDILGFPRVQSTALEPLYFANFLILPISLFVAALFGKIKTSGLLGLPLLIISGIAFILTVARGGYFGLIASLALIFIFSWRQILKPGKILALLATGLVVGFFAVQFLGGGTDAFSTQKFTQHLQNLFSGASYEERVATIDTSKQAFQKQPWV